MPNNIIDKESFNFITLFIRIVDYWYLFFISFILSIITAYFYTKYSTPLYQVSTTLMIENESPSFSSERVLEDMELFSKDRNILNEKVILGSYYIINETLKQLNFTITYYLDNGYSPIELYTSSPFLVIIDSLKPQAVNVFFELEFVSDNEFKLNCKGKGIDLYSYQNQELTDKINELEYSAKFTFGDKIETPYFSFWIISNDDYKFSNPDIGIKCKFVLNNLDELTLGYKKSLNIELYEKQVDVLSISLETKNITKGVDFLNQLTKVYIGEKLEKNNFNANSTIRFIDEQLLSISDSLLFAENRLQRFKSTSKVMDIDFQTQQLFDHILGLEKEKAILISQQKYFYYVLKSVKEGINLDKMMLPSTIGISDAILNNLIKELSDLSAKKITLSLNASKKSQAILNIETQINNIKELILSNINNSIESSDISINNIEKQLSILGEKAKKLPAIQQKLIDFERQFDLNNEIYNFLMKKRSEAQIAKASNTSNSEIIDKARQHVFEKISPKNSLVFLIAIFLGLLPPSALVFLSVIFKDTIMTRKDILKIADITIVEGIFQSNHTSMNVFVEKPNSPIAESFRSLYTNLQFYIKWKEQQVILISSAGKGEGKTFISVNLAMVFASFGIKTCLLSYDLRRPKIHQVFNLTNEIGLSSYLTGNSGIEDIIKFSGTQNLDIIITGTIPPNPVELIMSKQTENLIEYLKLMYQCVIIDSPPVGIVSDGLLLAKYSDINVIIARQNQTKKKAFIDLMYKIINNKLKNTTILLNGIKQNFIHGFDYCHELSYFEEEKEKSWIRLIKIFKRK
jgi:tyrosine-protein kinase Etk/Wzc